MKPFSPDKLQDISKKIRKHVIKMVFASQSSHIGAALSIVDILVVLYFHILNVNSKNYTNILRDKFVLSKAHASSALYATLAEKEIIPYLTKNTSVH